MSNGRFRLVAVKALTIAIALLIGFGLIEVVLRSFPGLIGLNVLEQMEPSLRAEIADRMGLPTQATSIRITSAMRSDGGPPFTLPGANASRYSFADPADIALGAREQIRSDENGLCNQPEKASLTKIDILIAGDSFTACTAIMPNEAASQRLEDMSGLITYNVGVGNTGPDEYLEMLKRFAPKMQPRIAVMNIYEGNDLRDVLRKKRFVESGGTSEKDRELQPPAWSYAAQFFEGAYKVAVRYIKANVVAAQDHNFRYSAPVGDHIMAMNITNKDQGEVERALELRDGKISTDAYAEPLTAYVTWAKSNGIVPVVAYLPSMYTVYEGTVRFEDANVGSAVQAFSAAQRRWFAAHADAIGFSYLDLTPFFQQAAAQGAVTHFPSNVHLSQKGQELVAVQTLEFLRKLGVAE
jgi:hypothetical protein